jgi:hypothetical protein
MLAFMKRKSGEKRRLRWEAAKEKICFSRQWSNLVKWLSRRPRCHRFRSVDGDPQTFSNLRKGKEERK